VKILFSVAAVVASLGAAELLLISNDVDNKTLDTLF